MSNCTLYIVKFFIGFDTLLFWPIFADFQNKAAGLCVYNSINKDVKWTFIVSYPNLKSQLFNQIQIFLFLYK